MFHYFFTFTTKVLLQLFNTFHIKVTFLIFLKKRKLADVDEDFENDQTEGGMASVAKVDYFF